MDLVEQDITDLIAAHRYRLSLTPPKQSNFRVVALIFYELTSETDSESCNETTATTTCKSISTGSNKRRYVVGTNDEPCTISGSICAERAALLQLRFLPNVTQITKVVIVTDSPQPISPGMLCREYMSSHDKIDIDTMDIVLFVVIVDWMCLLKMQMQSWKEVAVPVLQSISIMTFIGSIQHWQSCIP
eukprot:CAMPEP_0178628630 /NCGR_PEP_ID=MMETSP0698-20121128/9524_1 /TAXON_ID=265572 /ORGANISM="Extubocellulus spinifer, Strain CCMP396" /LENGTH=187 /DNA_ID=CAMNT_0020267893 /DNA_START=149 /DNA_END=709 /DNA_ORIENTATION=+